MVKTIWLDQFGDGHPCDYYEENDAGEGGGEGGCATVAISFEFVTDLVPSCM